MISVSGNDNICMVLTLVLFVFRCVGKGVRNEIWIFQKFWMGCASEGAAVFGEFCVLLAVCIVPV